MKQHRQAACIPQRIQHQFADVKNRYKNNVKSTNTYELLYLHKKIVSNLHLGTEGYAASL